MHLSKKNIVRICKTIVLFVLFSAVMYYPYLADSVSGSSFGRTSEDAPVLTHGCDMCLPPDNDNASDGSEISAAHYVPPIRPRADGTAQTFTPSDVYAFASEEISKGLIFCGESRTIHILRVMRC